MVVDQVTKVSEEELYCEDWTRTVKSSLPLNLGTNGFTCLLKFGEFYTFLVFEWNDRKDIHCKFQYNVKNSSTFVHTCA